MGSGDISFQPLSPAHRLLALRKLERLPGMASIVLNDAVVDFPIYGMQKSLRRALFGLLVRRGEGSEKRVVVRALNCVSTMFRDGDRVGLIGPNGAGKTT